MARINTRVSATGASTWAKPTHPASVNCDISVNVVPAKPRVKAPSGNRRQRESFRARNLSISTKPGSSSTGSVSGWQTKLVTPPAAAAANSLSNMPSCSWPGSRKRAARSTNPGATTRPTALITRLAAKSLCALPMATMRPAAMLTSVSSSRPDAGSITRPPRMRIFMLGCPRWWTSRPCALRCQK